MGRVIMSIVFLVLGIVFAALAWSCYKRYKNVSDLLKREGEMTGFAEGRISELVEVRRRNRSFRWVNEYPVVSFCVNGKEYTTTIECAEKRRGTYQLNGQCHIHYLSEDPSICVVDEFRKSMQSLKKSSLITIVVLAFLAFNCLFSFFAYLSQSLF